MMINNEIKMIRFDCEYLLKIINSLRIYSISHYYEIQIKKK